MLLVQFKVMWLFSSHLHMQRPVPPEICADYNSICSMYTVWEVFCLKYVIVGYQKSNRHIQFWPHDTIARLFLRFPPCLPSATRVFWGGVFPHFETFRSQYKRWTQRKPGLLSLLLLACLGASAGPRGSWWLNTCSLVVPETTSLCQLLHGDYLL